MTVQDSNDVLVRGDNGGDFLSRINLTTGAVTPIGSMAVSGLLTGLDFASDGNLYGLTGAGNVYIVNPNTAAVTLVGNTGNQFWLDLTAAGPTGVPEPGALAFLCCLCAPAAVLARRRMRRR